VGVARDPAVPSRLAGHPRAGPVAGNAADEAVDECAADLAEERAPLAGWVNNAAIFRDASVHTSSPREVLDLVRANLAPVVVGCTAACAASSPRAPAGPSSTFRHSRRSARCRADRALAVEYGVRVNAVALGSIATERYAVFLDGLDPEDAAHVTQEMRRVHPLGRIGTPAEVAATIARLLSDEAGFRPRRHRSRRRGPVGAGPRPGGPRDLSPVTDRIHYGHHGRRRPVTVS
jgi:NAD(P)-dependent dehydrogenase (short-subunit alcohol dehydrogenase family)